MTADFLIVDDHPAIAFGIAQQIGERGLGTTAVAHSIAEARGMLNEHVPKALIVDLGLEDGDGIDFFAEVSERHLELPGLLLSGVLSDVDVQRAHSLGFAGIVTKTSSLDLVMEGLEQIVAGGRFYSPDIRPIVESLDGGDLFTPRMIEVLRMLNRGLSNQQIASNLEVSEATVSFHVSQIKSRLGARTNRQILSQARKLGISLTTP